MDRNTTTFAGPSTHDEMCLVYLDYYPAAFGGFACISGQDKEVVLTAIDGYDPIKYEDRMNLYNRAQSYHACMASVIRSRAATIHPQNSA